MPESRLLWFHRRASAGSFTALNYFWNSPRDALISEEMEGRMCLSNLTPLKHNAHNRKKSKDNRERAALSLEPSSFLGRLFQELVSVFQTGLIISLNVLLNESKSQGEPLIIWQLILWSGNIPVNYPPEEGLNAGHKTTTAGRDVVSNMSTAGRATDRWHVSRHKKIPPVLQEMEIGLWFWTCVFSAWTEVCALYGLQHFLLILICFLFYVMFMWWLFQLRN